MDKKIKERIAYLEQQIAASDRLDGWSLRGAKKELKELKIKLTGIPFDKLNGI